jgi:sirohydrochlorin cobaltochelatase
MVPLGSDDGVLLVGHGTRDAGGITAFFELTDLVREGMVGGTLAPCFLEFAEPTIGQGVDLLAQSGAKRILVVPLMLFAAGHVRRDIPRAVATAASRYPQVETRQTAHLGCSPSLVELSAERFRAALSGRPQGTTEDTALVLVGRGNRDVEALAEMRRFAEIRRELTPVARVETCYLAMGKPSLSEMLALAPAMAPKRIVVQPHLLFPGRLSDTIREAVEVARRGCPGKEWLLAQPLGPDRLLADAVLSLLAPAAGWAADQLDRALVETKSDSRLPKSPRLRKSPPLEYTPCSE